MDSEELIQVLQAIVVGEFSPYQSGTSRRRGTRRFEEEEQEWKFLNDYRVTNLRKLCTKSFNSSSSASVLN